MDQPWIARGQSGSAAAELAGDAGPEIHHQHISTIGELQRHVQICGLRQIQHDTSLAAIDGQEQRAVPATVRVADKQANVLVVIAAGRLHFDDAGAEISQQGCGIRPGQYPAEVEHAKSIEQP